MLKGAPTYPSQISVREAIDFIKANTPSLGTESLNLADAYGRVLAKDVKSLVSHPSCDNSALDGYACRAEDTRAATKQAPVTLKVIGDVPAGSQFNKQLGEGEAVGIYTGAPIPSGANAIIRVEDTKLIGDTVQLFTPASPNDIRPKGQDFMAGETLLQAGTKLNAAALGMAAAMGQASLEVVRPPRLGILATGDEVIEPGQPIREGQVYNSNSYSLYGLVKAAGAQVILLPHVKDDQASLAKAISDAGQPDLLLTSGGVSMGKYDFVRDLLFDEGEVYFWKVAMKPAGPVLFGRWQGLPILGLPGNPVSSMVAFLILARAFIHEAAGLQEPLPYENRLTATSKLTLKAAGFKETFIRLKLEQKDGVFYADSTGSQSSGVLSSMLYADALACLAPHTSVQAGERVELIPLAPYLS